MIQSMTGYGKATAELPDKKINVEIKSLNSKAMDLSTRIAPAYREKEIEIRNEISKVLERGKVDFSLWIEKKESAESATPINQVLVEGYYKQIQAISENLGIPVPTDWFQTLLRMPDVMSKTEIQELTEEEWEMVRATVLEAIGHLVDFRKQEGAALEKKFREKIANIALLLEKITPYEKERVEKVKERITDALEKTLNTDYDKNRLEQELIYYIEKLDVNEEKQRLTNHLKYFISTLESGNGQGKKLGFIAQEMGREINTLGSKSNHAEMQKIVVQMKDELEQIKEQVLNAPELIRVEDLHKSFGSLKVLNGITETIHKGEVVSLIGPSGSGKSTIINYLLTQNLNLAFSISATSRPPRGTEKHGVEYFFLTPEEFGCRIENNEFLEYEEVYKDRYYGTLKEQVEKQLEKGQNVVFDLDVVGGCNIKKYYGERALSIFVQPPSIEELRCRLTGRGTDEPEVIECRIAKAEYEMTFAPQFDRVIVNDDLEAAKAETLEVIKEFLNKE